MTSFLFARLLATLAALSVLAAPVTAHWYGWGILPAWLLTAAACAWMAAKDTRQTRAYRAHIRQVKRDRYADDTRVLTAVRKRDKAAAA